MNVRERITGKIEHVRQGCMEMLKRSDAIRYHFDALHYEKGLLSFSGWIFSQKVKVDNVAVWFCTDKSQKRFPLGLFCREDVAKAFDLEENCCGFWMEAKISSDRTVEMFLEYEVNGKSRKWKLMDIPPEKKEAEFEVTADILTPYDDTDVKYFFDDLVCEGNHIYLRGWFFLKKNVLQNLNLVFHSRESEKMVPLRLSRRVDVANAYGVGHSHCGFRFDAEFYCGSELSVFLEYGTQNQKGRVYLFNVQANAEQKGICISENKLLSFRELTDQFMTQKPYISDEVYNTRADVIVPVYNGFEYLENLLFSLEKTSVPYRLFIVDDKSTDERVLPFLRQYAEGKANVFLMENEENLGFVQSVNRALKASENHVALVNSDVILPEQWLERLMTPFVEYDDVASATPFTNSGTICSFPNFCENNTLFLDLSVDEIDREFSRIRPRYVEMPTGIGFCMGMNRKAIEEVGFLDAETFYKGYGEENDWCQRAIRKGYRNVHVENLFVWHKHGGSFLSEDKKRYIERNLKLLGERYPSYDTDVQEYCRKDPNGQIRELVKLELILSTVSEFTLVFNHNWGGGADSYMQERVRRLTSSGKGVIEIVDDAEIGLMIKVRFKEAYAVFYAGNFSELFDVIKRIRCEEIIVNELVSFEDLVRTQEFIVFLKNTFSTRITMLCHDFYAICPSIYLLDDKQKHCFLPDDIECQKCFDTNTNKMNREYASIQNWRQQWGKFLEKCDHVIVFSENSKLYYQKCYPSIRYEVVPHEVDYISPVPQYEKTSDVITIGVIGNLMPSKGAGIIYEMAELIKEQNIKARIVVIGPDLDGKTGEKDNIIIHGKYKREELPELMKKYQVDVVFIASIWPETFSYTTEEAIKMGMKVAAFDLGAPAERLRKYSKGIIIKEITAEAALKKIMENV